MQSKEMLLSFNRVKLLMWLNANEGFTMRGYRMAQGANPRFIVYTPQI